MDAADAILASQRVANEADAGSAWLCALRRFFLRAPMSAASTSVRRVVTQFAPRVASSQDQALCSGWRGRSGHLQREARANSS
jgi:hypothetical protein